MKRSSLLALTVLPQVFTITTPLRQQEVEAADRLVRQLSPGARRTYALGGTQKYELPTTEVTLSQVRTRHTQHKSGDRSEHEEQNRADSGLQPSLVLAS